MPLNGIDVIQCVLLYVRTNLNQPNSSSPRIAAGQNTTYILAHPNEQFSDLPRHPLNIEAPDFCVVCNEDHGDDDAPLECDKVSPTVSIDIILDPRLGRR